MPIWLKRVCDLVEAMPTRNMVRSQWAQPFSQDSSKRMDIGLN